MALELLIFDLDNTLLRTGDLEPFRGEEGIGPRTPDRIQALIEASRKGPDRRLYSQEDLLALGQGRRIAVFTRSPRAYATTLLDQWYPGVHWACVVAFEDVPHTKPHPDGIWAAMRALGIPDPQNVAVVGDEKADILAAYRAGCWAFLDQGAWPNPWSSPQYNAMERVADITFSGPGELRGRIADPIAALPVLELASERPGANLLQAPRFEAINHFIPATVGNGSAWIHVLGRAFSDYQELQARRIWHRLTHEIGALKDAQHFPQHWIDALRAYLHHSWPIQNNRETVITVVPFKPGRQPRLEKLLVQLEASHSHNGIHQFADVEFRGDVLRYTQGVRSHHGDHLSRDERFTNVRDHLEVVDPARVHGKHVVVIDDVATTGASLIYASQYLRSAGASKVHCVALAKAIGPQ